LLSADVPDAALPPPSMESYLLHPCSRPASLQSLCARGICTSLCGKATWHTIPHGLQAIADWRPLGQSRHHRKIRALDCFATLAMPQEASATGHAVIVSGAAVADRSEQASGRADLRSRCGFLDGGTAALPVTAPYFRLAYMALAPASPALHASRIGSAMMPQPRL